jgi:hypothetical protein
LIILLLLIVLFIFSFIVIDNWLCLNVDLEEGSINSLMAIAPLVKDLGVRSTLTVTSIRVNIDPHAFTVASKTGERVHIVVSTGVL